MLVRTLSSLVAIAGLSGCALLPVTGNLPSHKDLDAYPAALLTAELVVDGDCVFATNAESGGRWLPIWPAGYSLENGVISDRDGPIARIGEGVKLGGGEYHASQSEFVQTLLVVPIPPSCQGGDYWLVSEVVN
jgi:hypothetical protein